MNNSGFFFPNPVGIRAGQSSTSIPVSASAPQLNHPRIPERIVHAKGAGAFGVFEATHDISDICRAKVFKVGTKTRVLARFSTCADGSAASDPVRQTHGFSAKMYTDDGIWDLVCSSLPVFLIRNPGIFPMMGQALKRNPQTQSKDPNAVWNFLGSHPETMHQTILLHSDRGIPDGFRFMDGYAAHTFKMVNDKGQFVWVKFQLRCDKDIKTLEPNNARAIASTQPDYAAADLFNAIVTKKFPVWSLCVQVMTDEQASKCSFDPFDITKVFPLKEYPLRTIGKLTLNENPSNFHFQIEQAAFTPAQMPPGIEGSPDRILQLRTTMYAEQQLRRVGPNKLLIPVNNPQTNKNFAQRRNSVTTPQVPTQPSRIGPHTRFNEDNFSQPRNFCLNVLDNRGRAKLTHSIAESLARCTDRNVVHRALTTLANVDNELARKIAEIIRF